MNFRKFIYILGLLFIPVTLPAAEGLFQVNSLFRWSAYPVTGNNGTDVILSTEAGLNLKTAYGNKVKGVVDLSVLFPVEIKNRLYPSRKFTEFAAEGDKFSMDFLLGAGLVLEAGRWDFLLATGAHVGILALGSKFTVTTGIGFDLQARLNVSQKFTAQFGTKVNVDFAGVQSLTSSRDEFSGFPYSVGFYIGFGAGKLGKQ